MIKLSEREPIDILWAPTACVQAFAVLKPRGVVCILDQTTIHAASLSRIFREEYARHPDFFFTEPPPERWRSDGRAQAVELADAIVVGSTFAASTLAENGVDPAKVRVVPYGYDEGLFPTQRPSRASRSGRPAEFIYVGRVGPLKGAAYLLEAFKRIDPARARLTLVGALDLPEQTFARYAGHVRHLGRVPHRDIPALLSAADCFIFPSLFEGGGIALYEAAACGLGIIQTDACGDGVRQGNGLRIAAASTEAIVAAVETALEGDTLEQWADVSWNTREERSWENYRRAVVDLVSTIQTTGSQPSPGGERSSGGR
jgi:glycosyltransferase involved in cell wall biosynthesis